MWSFFYIPNYASCWLEFNVVVHAPTGGLVLYIKLFYWCDVLIHKLLVRSAVLFIHDSASVYVYILSFSSVACSGHVTLRRGRSVRVWVRSQMIISIWQYHNRILVHMVPAMQPLDFTTHSLITQWHPPRILVIMPNLGLTVYSQQVNTCRVVKAINLQAKNLLVPLRPTQNM